MPNNRFLWAKGWVAVLLMPVLLSCKGASETEQNANALQPGASLKWEITDSKGKVIGQGERNFEASDFKLKGSRRDAHVDKTLELSDNFVLRIAEFFERDKSGFGLVASRTDQQTFSWEWFEVDSPTHATKLQEAGELSISTERGELTRTEFLTDVSLRVIRFPGGADPRNPDWRVRIAKGSYVNWPLAK